MKKFFSYFIVFFLISFTILNSRFVSARLDFWLREDEIKAAASRGSPPLIGETRPVAEAGGFVLTIPALGVEAPVVLEESLNPNVIFDRLEAGVVHYGTSPLPGQRGTAIILGHSSAYPWYQGEYGSVFALLGRLQVGDKIYVTSGNRVLTYQVKESLVFHPFSKDKRLEQLEQTDTSSIILVSCWPVGTNYKRIAIKADLI